MKLLIAIILFSSTSFGQSENEKAEKIFKDYFDILYTESDERIADYSLKTEENQYKALLKLKDRVQDLNLTNLSKDNQFHLEVLNRGMDEKLEGYKWRFHNYYIDHRFTFPIRIEFLLKNKNAIKNQKDAKIYLKKINDIPNVLNEIKERMPISQSYNALPPRSIVESTIKSISKKLEFIDTTTTRIENDIIKDFVTKLEKTEIDPILIKVLIAEARNSLKYNVVPELYKFKLLLESYLQNLDSRSGVWKMKDGDKYYSYQLKKHTSTNLTAKEIHDLGLYHVEQIHLKMKSALNKLGIYGSTMSDLFEKARKDPRFVFGGTDQDRQKYRDHLNLVIKNIKSVLPLLFNTFPKAKLEIREISGPGFFYSFPSADGKQPGIYYINLEKPSVYRLEVLAYHEALPGHHMQAGIQTELKDLPEFRKRYFSTAYAEGWGLYAENLPADEFIDKSVREKIGGYKDPIQDFGRLTIMLRRALRLVVDTGLHVFKWSKKDTREYFLKNSPEDYSGIDSQIDRYITMPGQATSYMVGMLKIIELRDRAKQKLGGLFDIREFHDIVLKNGSLPLDLLESVVDSWIEKKGSSNEN